MICRMKIEVLGTGWKACGTNGGEAGASRNESVPKRELRHEKEKHGNPCVPTTI